MKKKFKKIWGLMSIIFLGIGSWGLYSLFNQGASDLLLKLGISNFYLQTGLVVLVVIIFFTLSGTSFFKSIEKVVKG